MRTAAFLAIGLLSTAALRAQPRLTLEVRTDRELYRQNGDNQVYVQVRVRPETDDRAVAGIRNFAFVIDRSGSMAGDRIAALRPALATVVRTMNADDFVAVVVFGSEVETLVESQRVGNVADLDSTVARIEPEGGAALFDAINQAAAQVRRHAAANTLNKIVLVTDGPATKGPRTVPDFARLAEVLAAEGIGISAIGFGEECEDSALSAMARPSGGVFRYAAQPGDIDASLRAEIAPSSAVVGLDATLSVQFERSSRKAQSHSWHPATVHETLVSYRWPRLLAGEEVTVLASAEIDGFHARFDLLDFATVRLSWKDAATGESRELSRPMPVRFTSESALLREATDREVARAAARLIVREGLQKAIEHIDQRDFRRALRDLRAARTDVRDLNVDLDDSEIRATLARLDAFLATVQTRELNVLDRKILRAGLLNQFDPPAPNEPAAR